MSRRAALNLLVMLALMLTLAFIPVSASASELPVTPGEPSPAYLLYDCQTQSDIPEASCLALLALYDSTSGLGWTHQEGWLSSPPCYWRGVTCASGDVTQLNLQQNGLNGHLPPELGNLVHLQALNLRDNQLSGPIPQQIGNMRQLRSIYLNNNELNGAIPVQLGNLRELRSLYLNHNVLNGPIPHQLGNLTYLQDLNLSENDLTGDFPPEFGNLTGLINLNLNGNLLTGPLPPEIGNLTQLQMLELSFNPLNGMLPLSLLNLHQLTTFYFAQTHLCEPVTAEFLAWKATVPNWWGVDACYSISGRVTSVSGKGIAGVRISTGQSQLDSVATTGADGFYTLYDLQPGSYALTFYRCGLLFEPVNATIYDRSITGVNASPVGYQIFIGVSSR